MADDSSVTEEMAVQSYLRGNGTLEMLESELAVKAVRHLQHSSLVLLKYNQIDSPKSDPIVRECRGVILDESDNWKCVSRSYDRFFNYGEGCADQIDWDTAKVFEKLDGSLATLYHYAGEWRVATKGTPDGHGPAHNTGVTFAELFWDTWKGLGYRLPTGTLDCYIFELMTPETRIVVPHTERRLVLHGIRRLAPCKAGFLNFEMCPDFDGLLHGWEVVKQLPLSSFEDVVVAAKELNPMQGEGYVVRDDQFRRVKIKSPAYVALAHMKDGFGDRRMIELIRTNEGSEFLSYFEEYRPLYDRMNAKYDALAAELEARYEEIKGIESQKDFAFAAQKCRLPAALFSVRNKKAASVRAHLSEMSLPVLEKLLA
jgi:hypothetical protein